ncbi:MAG: c-type cytochrome [Gammaproteobacteria bacterium]|nr:c-type cytochrome [Gammaproteobacteria bacterium]
MDKSIISIVAALSLVLSPMVLAVGDPAAGKAKSAVCAGCHGADGNSTNPEWPKLAGQHPSYIAKQLRDYKSGNRQNATMLGMVAALSNQDMDDLAAYFGSQPATGGEADPALVDLGEKIYRGGNAETGLAACIGCHGPAGAGNPAAKFPYLAGQHAQYTVTTLGHFKSEARANDPNKMMRLVAGRMTKQEIDAVSSYLAGLYR